MFKTSARNRFFFLAAFLFLSATPFASRAEDKKQDDKNQARYFGDVSILTNYVRKGLTQTEGDPSFQTGFGYQFSPLLRLGLWGSNVSYPNETAHLNFKAYARFRVDFTQNIFLLFKYDFDRYYRASQRNGTVLNLDFSIFDYHVYYVKDDNWEGTDSEATWWAFGKEFSLTQSFLLEVVAGYSMLDVQGMENYFDAKATLSYKTDPIKLSLALTATTNASQFNGRGNPAVSLSMATQF